MSCPVCGIYNATLQAENNPKEVYCHQDCADIAYGISADSNDDLTPSKAREILDDGSVHGKPLTSKQRRYFGWVAGGRKKRR